MAEDVIVVNNSIECFSQEGVRKWVKECQFIV